MDLFHHEAIAWLALALTLVITILGWMLSTQAIEKRADDRFAFEVQDAQQRIQIRFNRYEQILRGGVAFFDAHTHVSRAHWNKYVTSLKLQVNLPGLQGFAFAERVDQTDLPEHIVRVRAEGFPQYTVAPGGQRDLYFPVTLIEPFDLQNQRAFGFDMFSEPVRREAMTRAMDTGRATLSGIVQLKQDSAENATPGFLMYLPVYQSAQEPNSVQDRRQAIRGFIYSPFRGVDLMGNVLGQGKTPLSFKLYDSANLTPQSLIYDSRPDEKINARSALANHGHMATVPIDLPGRTWMVQFKSTPSFDEQVHNVTPKLILFAGGIINLLLFLTIFSLVQQRKKLSASRAKSLFLANMSHEIRTPLNAIIGLNSFIKEQVKDPQTARYAQQAQDASEHLLSLLNDVLCFSHIESGRAKTESIDFNLRDQVEKTVGRFKLRATEKGLQLEIEFDTSNPVWIKGDSTRYAQVLGNLLSNAIKFSQAGRVLVKVQIEARKPTELLVRTEVHDQGVGFDMREFERLVTPFEQADNTTTRRFGGTGLGLAISKSLAELMGGTLFVSSKIGEGSMFGFTARCQRMDVEPELVDNSVHVTDTVSLQGKKILVVEDNHLNQQVIKALLSRLNVNVQVVGNGELAVDAVQQNPDIDLVLMDVHMPVMNGIDATSAIRQLPGPAANVPIVALTACALHEDELACRAAGMNEFLTKPVNVPLLQQVLVRFLSATH
ncbi:CHASE domain-containing protein [Limnobacter sp.]|uniref:CHASE domain-containing protein n=1 Tax=Limnobacter sp. TaxID=2003368 RepID=UPI002FE18459